MNKLPDHPLPHAYWAIPGKLLAGAYPGSKFSDDQARNNLDKLLSVGISLFINLTQPHELRPYESILYEQAGWLDVEVAHRRFPIMDMHCPPKEQVIEILDVIDEALENGQRVYVHCWGGIGRTGTIIGCHMVRHGMKGDDALDAIALLRAGTNSGWVRSPETDEQVRMVRRWKEGE